MRSQENIPFQASLLWRVFCTSWLDFLNNTLLKIIQLSNSLYPCNLRSLDPSFPVFGLDAPLIYFRGDKSLFALFLCEAVSHGDWEGRLGLPVFKFQLYHLPGVWFGQFTWLFWFHFLIIPFYQKNKRDPPYKVDAYKELKAMSVTLHKMS